MEDEIEKYLESLEKRSRSRTTIEQYEHVIERCLRVLKENNLPTEAASIDDIGISCIMSGLDVKEPTKKNYLAILGMFIRFHTGKDPVRDMDLLWNRPQRNRKFITLTMFARLMGAANPTTRMVLVLGAFIGMRRKEMSEVRYSDIGPDFIVIHGKGHGTDGMVKEQPMPHSVVEEIERYNKWKSGLEGVDESDDHLLVFPSSGRIMNFENRLSAISNMISRLGKECEIEVTCHSLRRLYCTTLFEQNCSLGTIKELMRHSNINTTLQCYIDPVELKTKEWSDKLSDRIMLSLRKEDDDKKGR